jgi:DNA-binding CsgD family transcriptional regulator
MKMKIVSKRSRIVAALVKGEKLTAKQIASRFKISNPTATISDIRRRDNLKVALVRGSKSTKYALVG